MSESRQAHFRHLVPIFSWHLLPGEVLSFYSFTYQVDPQVISFFTQLTRT